MLRLTDAPRFHDQKASLAAGFEAQANATAAAMKKNMVDSDSGLFTDTVLRYSTAVFASQRLPVPAQRMPYACSTAAMCLLNG